MPMLDLFTAFLGTLLDMMMLIWRQFMKIQWSGALGTVAVSTTEKYTLPKFCIRVP